MNTKRFVLILTFCLFFLNNFLCDTSYAQRNRDRDSQVSIVILDIPATCQLLISNADASKSLTTDGSSEDAFEAGYVEFDLGNPTLYVSANKSWKMNIKSSGFSLNGTYQKPVSDLMLKDTGPHG